MKIDFSDYLAINTDVYISDHKNQISCLDFYSNKTSDFVANIEVGNFLIIELFGQPNSIVMYVWNTKLDSTILEKEIKNIDSFQIENEIINTINFCKKYYKMIAFS